MDPDQQQSYYTTRNMVFLNNTAVSLLGRGCYTEALETIKDAVEILKAGCKEARVAFPVVCPASGRASSPRCFDEGLMERASRRLSAMCNTPNNTTSTSNVCVVTVSEDACTTDMDSVLRMCPVRDSVVFPIKIESYESFSDSLHHMKDDVRLTCATVLHNYGIASLLRANNGTTGRSSGAVTPKMWQTQSKTFQVCQAMLAFLCSSCTDPHQKRRLYFLGYLSLSTWVVASLFFGLKQEARVHHEKLDKLRAVIRELGLRSGGEFTTRKRTHAAAA